MPSIGQDPSDSLCVRMMFARVVVLLAAIAIASALVPSRFGRASVRMQSAEPWFPNSVTSNTVSMNELEYVSFARSLCLLSFVGVLVASTNVFYSLFGLLLLFCC